ncbi:sugar transferase [Candidatus Saccharibacteria bacterium]|nr:sugar transferase [Candidatus Saccharibacteria bacterium]
MELAVQDTLQLQTGYGFLSVDVRKKLRAVRFVAYGVLKRVLDLLLSVGLLAILTPVFVIIAILVKIDSPGPVLFKQERVGRNGRIFKILKFRSMVADNDINDNSCDDQYTKWGKVLRRTSLDELPQLFNVLMGQMSFIGPRPWIADYWTNMNKEERERCKVRPGITGLAAAKGRNDLTIFEKIDYDLEYVRNYSLWQDVKVILMTVRTVLTHEGAEAGKSGVYDDIGELKAKNRGPKARIVLSLDPLVSVMVSAYNSKRYIKNKVSAAVGRDYEDLELVMVNDSFTDEVKEVIEKLTAEGVKMTRARVGEDVKDIKIDQAEGVFPCFVDTDAGDALRLGQMLEKLGARE